MAVNTGQAEPLRPSNSLSMGLMT